MKILLTGNQGFIGKYLKKRLSGEIKKILLSQFGSIDEKIEIKDIDFNYEISGCDIKNSPTEDITNELAMKALFKKIRPEIVIHLAAKTGVREGEKNPQEYINTNVYGTSLLLNLSKEYDIKKFLFASSSSIYGNQKCPLREEMGYGAKPLSLYALTKIAGELLCEMFKNDFPVIIFRPFTVYGENGREEMVVRKIIDVAKREKVFYKYGDGNSVRGYTFVEDLVDGIIKLIGYEPKDNFEIFNLGGVEQVKLNYLIEIIKKQFPNLKVEETERHPADVYQSYADITKAKKLLGWKPKRNFKEEIERLCLIKS